MSVASDLFSLSERYLADEATVDELDRWLAAHAQEIASLPADNPMAHLAGLIEVVLAEIDDGLQSERDLRRSVGDFIESYARLLESTSSVSSSNRTHNDADPHVRYSGGAPIAASGTKA